MIHASNYINNPRWLMWCIESEEGFLAIGTRNINALNLEADYGYEGEYTMFSSPYASGGFYRNPDYDLSGKMRSFTMVSGKTEMEALFGLLRAFSDEEAEEKRQQERIEANKIANELYSIKEKKAHKKQKKAEKQGKFDATYCLTDCSLCEEENPDYCECCR